MDHSVHNKIVSFIWSIANDCLRDVFVLGKYRDVILPMFALHHLVLLLERLIQQAISVERQRDPNLYKRYASDPDFKRAFDASVSRLLASTTRQTLFTGT